MSAFVPTSVRHHDYSYLNASVGCSRDALSAGSIPNTTPTTHDTPNATIIEVVDTGIRNVGSKNRTLYGIAVPIAIPAIPPTRLIRVASERNCVRISRRDA